MKPNNLAITDEEFERIRRKIYQAIGVNLTEKKRALVVSRLSKRLRQLEISSFSAYLDYLDRYPEELDTVFNLITTNVTNFFREKHHFEYLVNNYLPELEAQVKGQHEPVQVRAWSAGCSTGEEPYSLAMTLDNYFEGKRGWQVKILASDINKEVLAKAKQGIYSSENVKGMPYNYLKKYFLMGTGENQGKFKVKDKLKNMIMFKRVNLAEDERYPLKEKLNIIFCRNVFIYFDKETQVRILRSFHQFLYPGGILCLGHSESIDPKEIKRGYWHNEGRTIYRKPISEQY